MICRYITYISKLESIEFKAGWNLIEPFLNLPIKKDDTEENKNKK